MTERLLGTVRGQGFADEGGFKFIHVGEKRFTAEEVRRAMALYESKSAIVPDELARAVVDAMMPCIEKAIRSALNNKA